MSPDLAIPASPAALRNEGSGFLPLTAKAASFRGIGYARRDGVTLHMGQYQGGFALCTVMSGEILDSEFRLVTPIDVAAPTAAYVRIVDADETANSFVIDLETYDGDSPFDRAEEIAMTRLGRSSTFMSEPVELYPPGASPSGAAPASRRLAATGTSTKRVRLKPGDEKVEAIKRLPSRRVAINVTRFLNTPTIPSGLRVALTLYQGTKFGDGTPYYFLADPSFVGPILGERLDPSPPVTWSIDPPAAAQEGTGQIARIEIEPAEGQTPVQAYLRGIRISTGEGTLPATKLVVTAVAPGNVKASVGIRIARPAALGAHTEIFRDYEGVPVDLKKLIIDTADRYGIPPHYLAAQMYAESAFNPYSYRYEATSWDFKVLVGDWHQAVVGGVRQLYAGTAAFSKLGIRRGTAAEFLPSQTAPPDSLTPGTARIPGQEPPAIESYTFVADGSSTSYQVPGLNGDKIQLGVDVRRPGAVLREFAQDLLADCAGDALTLSEFCVDGDAGTLRFGLPPVGQQVVSFRRVKVLRDLPPPGDFGSLIGGAAEQQAAIDKIRLKNPLENIRPPASLSMTIRQWAIQRGTNPLAGNTLARWGETFKDANLFTLIKRDPSFEVQGQWFGAASYGLLQVLPETVRTLYGNREALSAADAAFLRTTYYDPMTQSPLERLFDPANCVPLGAEIDVRARVISEDQDPDCAYKRNECTWRNNWGRRFCRFNTGYEVPCQYGNKILFGIVYQDGSSEPPLVDSFVPRLNP